MAFDPKNIDYDPIDLKLDAREDYLFVLTHQPNDNKNKQSKKQLLIYKTLDLKVIHTENDLPSEFTNLFLISPIYNENAKRTLLIFQATFESILNDFQIFNQLYYSQDKDFSEIKKTHLEIGSQVQDKIRSFYQQSSKKIELLKDGK